MNGTANDLAQLEHSGWLHVGVEWERLGLPDMNDPKCDPLIRAIELWGERLAAFRREQRLDYCDAAIIRAMERYDASGEDD